MYILGLNLIHDTSAALIKNGKVLAAAEEERFNRERHTSAFPKESIEYCLKYAGIGLEDIDYATTSFAFEKFVKNTNPFEHNTLAHDDATNAGRKKIVLDNNLMYLETARKIEMLGLPEVTSIPHHLAHAAGAYYLSGFKNSNILVIDGRGENESTSLMQGDNGEISLIENYGVKDSLCHLYTYVTNLCGLYSNIGQEGKTMGLSAYGEPGISFSNILLFGKNHYEINRNGMRELTKHKTQLGEINRTSKNLAHGTQKCFENAVVFLAKKLEKITGGSNISLSGGGALNCEANRVLLSQDFVDNLYVQPSANDAGTSVGAALYLHSQFKGLKPSKQEDVYLGPNYSSDEIENVLEASKVSFEKKNNIARATAELLSGGNIVGWFQGRMEFGPRALGNRSILADPRDHGMKNKLNRSVKHRENWRPFAPSILYGSMEEYFGVKCHAPHMTISFNTIKEKINNIQAAVHVDGTARIQTVEKKRNKRFYELIKSFQDITNVPVLLNTSFNDNGRPMVRSPQDALQCFFSTGLDILVLEDYIIIK